jgi:ribonucleoside-triphosphate reductase
MLIETTFSEDYDNLYNKFNQNEHGKKLLDIDGISRRCLDVGSMSHAYFTQNLSNVTIDNNANADEGISPNNYGSEIVRGIQKLEGYYLIHRYATKRFDLKRANELLRSIWLGDVYFHDSSGIGVQQPYCFAASTTMIMLEGRPYGNLHSLPPKHSESFIGQCIEFTMDLSQAFVGAIALGDFFVNFAWYSKKENLSDKTIQNELQKFVHVVNNSFRVGGQSPFTNLSLFDRPNLEKVFEHHLYPDGSKPDFDYIVHIQKIFAEWFAKGDPASGFPYRFPIVTINLLTDLNKNIVDKDFLDFISRVNLERGCFNIYVNSGEKVASCCRLINDSSRMNFKSDTLGNGGVQIGSHRVVTLNLPRIALRSKGDLKKFYSELDTILETSRDLLQIHREEILRRRVERGFLKFFEPLKWFSLKHLFSTVGIIGVSEMNKLMGFDITSEDGTQFTLDVLNYIEDFAKKTSIETKHSFNVEEIPGESVASKLCQKDKVIFGEDKVPFELYSNQYIPLIENVSLPERIITTGKFMEILSGGGILHLNVAEQIKDSTIMKHLIEYSVQNGISHMAVNYGFGTCKNSHTTICGNSPKCSICGEDIDDYVTRIIGYFSKVSNWSKTRRQFEFPKRVFQ